MISSQSAGSTAPSMVAKPCVSSCWTCASKSMLMGRRGLVVGAPASRHAGVDHEVVAIDVVALVAGQEQRRRGDVLGQAGFEDRRRLGEVALQLGHRRL